VISGGELKIHRIMMEAIMKWKVPTIFIEVRSFVGETQYLQKFIASFSVVVALVLHAIRMNGKSLQWGKNEQKDFDELEKKDQASTISCIIELLKSLQSGNRCKWVCHGRNFDVARRKSYMLSF
jgi:hypothetical protein